MAELTDWKDPALPIRVEFEPDAMERIRLMAVEGLLSLRRVGVGVGGLLLGKYTDGNAEVLDVREIACGHKFGPSFRLTPEETAAVAADAAAAGEFRVVGLYCSKPRGVAEPNDGDRELFEAVCPERWQTLLVVRPSANDESVAAMYARGGGAALVGGTPLPLSVPWVTPKVTKAERVAARPAPEPISVPPAAPKPAPEKHSLFAAPPVVPDFAPVAPVRNSGRKPLVTGAAALGLVALCAGAFLTRAGWMPRPGPELRSYDTSGILTVEWNRSAVRGIDNGSLVVNDGAESRTIVLSGTELHSGSFRFRRNTGRVSVLLRAGPVQDAITFKEVPPLEPPQPPPAQP